MGEGGRWRVGGLNKERASNRPLKPPRRSILNVLKADVLSSSQGGNDLVKSTNDLYTRCLDRFSYVLPGQVHAVAISIHFQGSHTREETIKCDGITAAVHIRHRLTSFSVDAQSIQPKSNVSCRTRVIFRNFL